MPWAITGKSTGISPALTNGRSVNHFGGIVLDQAHAFRCRFVGQTEDRYVSGVEEAFALIRILAFIRGDRKDFKVAPPGQPVTELQPRRPSFAVDKYLCDHLSLPSDHRVRGHTRCRCGLLQSSGGAPGSLHPSLSRAGARARAKFRALQ